jgi:hypothetical protein
LPSISDTNMRIALIYTLLFLGQSLATWGQSLVKETLDPTVSISVPENFRRLQGEAAARRSLSSHTPLGVYVDPAGDADMVVNTANAFFDSKDMAIMKAFYKSNILNLFSKVTFIREANEKISGKPGFVFEFTAEVAEKGKTPIRKYIQAHYGLRKRRVIVATFSCEAKNKDKWIKTATAALSTLKITEK